MKLPRDISGQVLAKKLQKFGYEGVRQTGSHIRLTTNEKGGHHITMPAHKELKIGTLSAILADIAEHHKISMHELIQDLFDIKKE